MSGFATIGFMSKVTKGKVVDYCRMMNVSPEMSRIPCGMKDWLRNSSCLRLWGQFFGVYLEQNL